GVTLQRSAHAPADDIPSGCRGIDSCRIAAGNVSGLCGGFHITMDFLNDDRSTRGVRHYAAGHGTRTDRTHTRLKFRISGNISNLERPALAAKFGITADIA